jgi:hypothetical protein
MIHRNTALNATVLSVLMMLAAVGGVAFVGTAGAAAEASISADSSALGATAVHTATGTVGAADDRDSLNSIQIDYSVEGDFDGTVSNVDQSDVLTAEIVRSNGTTVDVSDDLSSVTETNNGEALMIGFGGSYTLNQGDVLRVSYGSAENPTTTGEHEVEIAINVQSTDDPTTATYVISDDERDSDSDSNSDSDDADAPDEPDALDQPDSDDPTSN